MVEQAKQEYGRDLKLSDQKRFEKMCIRDSMIAVPVDVTFSSFRVNVLAVGKVGTAVIVLGVVSAVCSGSSVVSC